jgi:hypothetical protein
MPGYLWFMSLRQQQQRQEAASKPPETTTEGTQQLPSAKHQAKSECIKQVII